LAKTRQEIENRMLTPVFTFKPKSPAPTYTRCGCGKPALYEVYEHHEPHCRGCMLEAVDCSTFVQVRRFEGGYDDAS
jgi:hypothetical protein